MRYQIIAADNLHTLQTIVNNELKHDWEVTGGLIAFDHRVALSLPPEHIYAQAMITHKPEAQRQSDPFVRPLA